EAGNIAVGEGAVNQVTQDQRPDQPQPGARQDGEEHPGDQPPVWPGVARHPPEQRPGHAGLFARACEAVMPAKVHAASVLYMALLQKPPGARLPLVADSRWFLQQNPRIPLQLLPGEKSTAYQTTIPYRRRAGRDTAPYDAVCA